MPKPVVVVGAGLAGLACARRLRLSGVPVIVVEGDSRIGGRLKTDEKDGFLLDRGFQVLFTGYPAAESELNFAELDFRVFSPGATIWDGRQLNDVDASNPISLALSSFLSMSDKMTLADWTLDMRGLSLQQIGREADVPAERALRQNGFSIEAIDRFFRPFLGGVFMDRNLAFSRRAMDFVWKMLVSGQTVVPSRGIAAVPAQLACHLDIETGAKVDRLRGDRRVDGVVLTDGRTIEAESVVLATEAHEATRLSGFDLPSEWRSQVCLHFKAPVAPTDDKLIVLTSEPTLSNMVVPMSNVAPEYAPGGKHLVNVTVLGGQSDSDESLAERVKSEVAEWFPQREVEGWRLLQVDRIAYAQMAQPPGFQHRLGSNTPGRDGLYLAGEFTIGSSIHGALQSGVDCARLIVEDLSGVRA